MGSLDKRLTNMVKVKIPRCIKPAYFGDVSNRQLHHFGDASELAYGVTSYLRFENSQGEAHCVLIMAKSRLAPIKKMTVPRLELSAATLAVRQDKFIRKEIDVHIDETHFWTDSTIVLQYITNKDKRFQTFVANRIAIIRDGSSPSQWHHVATKENPADDASRGLSANDLTSPRWINGPKFLTKSNTSWPKPIDIQEVSDDDPEVKKEKEVKAYVAVRDHCEPMQMLIDNSSNWIKLKTSLA